MGKQSRRKKILVPLRKAPEALRGETIQALSAMTPQQARSRLEAIPGVSRASIPKDFNKPSFASEKPLELIPVETPKDWLESQLRFGNTNAYVALYMLGECTVIVTREYDRWHLSIAHKSRNPTWREITEARYRILPDDLNMAIVLPSRKYYVNFHEFCYQMLEVRDEHLDLLNSF